MLTLLSFIIFVGALWSLAFYKVPLKISTAVIGVILICYSLFQVWSWWFLIPVWMIFLIVAAATNVPAIRRPFLSVKILTYFRSSLPPMSKTERIALEAGDVWWEGELFCGRPDWQKLLAMPKPQLTEEEQKFVDNQVETLCSLINDYEVVHDDCDLSPETWQYLKDEGFFGLVIGKEYGGHGFSAIAHSTIVSKIASRSISAAVNTMVPNSLGPGELITYYGTEEQKKYFLPRLAKGHDIPAFGLTAPHAGSDATAITDSGIICRGEFEGKSIIGMRLNWNKRYITLSPVATVLGLAFKLYDPEHLLGDVEDIGITLCLIPTKTSGVEVGKRHLPMGLAFLNGPTRGKDVFVPLDFIIGGPEMRGKGWYMLMEALSIGRGISLPALSAGAAKLCYRGTGAYSLVRKQFKMSIGKLEGIQEALARIGGFTYICEATRLMTASAVDQKVRPSLASAIAKYHLTEMGRRLVLDAMDVHAGKTVQLGQKNYLGLLYDSLPMSITVEGANILTRNLIIFGQGALRCHPYIRQEMEAAQIENSQESLVKFDNLIFAHVGYAISNFSRNFAYGLTGGIFISAPKNSLEDYYRQLTRMSTALAMTADIAMVILGGELKRSERLSARLGDVLSYLYLASSVLRYFENEGQPTSDLKFVRWSLQWCLAQIQIAFDDFFANFPVRWLAKILHGMTFPWGRSYKMPTDKLGQSIAEEMMRLSAFRERITKYCFIGKNNDDGICCMENAFQALVVSEPVKVKLQNAIRAGRIPRQGGFQEQADAAIKAGILTADEIQLLRDAQALSEAAIQVDEFDASELSRNKRSIKNQSAKQTSSAV